MKLSDIVQLAQSIGTLSAILTVLALVIGGGFALKRYRREVRLRAADLLLKMEDEYRIVLPTCLEFEYIPRYQQSIVPLLKKIEDHPLNASDVNSLAALDRCLRFFFLCTVLTSDLKVEETAIARAYYYYLSLLAEPKKREELKQYITRNYKRLDTWMKRHKVCMERYRETGEWDWRLVVDAPELQVVQKQSSLSGAATAGSIKE